MVVVVEVVVVVVVGASVALNSIGVVLKISMKDWKGSLAFSEVTSGSNSGSDSSTEPC